MKTASHQFISNNPIEGEKIKMAEIKTKELFGMVQTEMTDHEFAKFMNKQDSNWAWDKINDEFNRFLAKGKMVALVKYKNDYPVNRWIWIDKKLIKKGE